MVGKPRDPTSSHCMTFDLKRTHAHATVGAEMSRLFFCWGQMVATWGRNVSPSCVCWIACFWPEFFHTFGALWIAVSRTSAFTMVLWKGREPREARSGQSTSDTEMSHDVLKSGHSGAGGAEMSCMLLPGAEMSRIFWLHTSNHVFLFLRSTAFLQLLSWGFLACIMLLLNGLGAQRSYLQSGQQTFKALPYMHATSKHSGRKRCSGMMCVMLQPIGAEMSRRFRLQSPNRMSSCNCRS